MKRFALAAMLSLAAGSAVAQQVGVSINVAQPGFYGQINIGNVPQPVVIYPQPVIVTPVPVGPPPPPIYLRVPPGHRKHWDRYCHDYRACGRPVYFVQEQWYQNVYLPHFYGEGYRGGDGDDWDHDRGHGHDRGHDHGRGHGEGHGHGHDRD